MNSDTVNYINSNEDVTELLKQNNIAQDILKKMTIDLKEKGVSSSVTVINLIQWAMGIYVTNNPAERWDYEYMILTKEIMKSFKNYNEE